MALNLGLLGKLDKMFDDGTNADCTIKCGEKEFKVWKFLLCAQSKVFEAMFSHSNTMESKTGVVQLDQFSASSVEKMLRFLYNNQAPEMNQTEAKELYKIADYLDLKQLRAFCVDKLYIPLDMDTIFDFLALAYENNAAELKAKAKSFVANNMAQVVNHQNWKELSETVRLEVIESSVKDFGLKKMMSFVELKGPKLRAHFETPNLALTIATSSRKASIHLTNEGACPLSFKIIHKGSNKFWIGAENGVIHPRNSFDLKVDNITRQDLPCEVLIAYAEVQQDSSGEWKIMDEKNLCRVESVQFSL